ncbi:MAG: aminotransferase class V-fold PLP-dependent enzyme [Eubacteriales bacterium]|nr:aminotransferase class V-fold PLP-dependent enzyme [Eubacteriales bacterium]
MIYLDSGATSFHKPPAVARAVIRAMNTCANPGRGGYPAAMEAARQVYRCREEAAWLFSCRPEQVVMTGSCTQGLNIAIATLVRPGARVVVSGFEHNAVIRPLHALGAEIVIAGRRLFDWQDTLDSFRRALDRGAEAAVFTHVSNVFGYILPVEQLAALCRDRGVPFIIDAAQSAGTMELNFEALGPAFIAMPGHKSLLGPQGTGILLCREGGRPLVFGGTGSLSASREMPPDLPERLEAGTLNVPGIAGLTQGLRYLNRVGVERVGRREHRQLRRCVAGLQSRGMAVFSGPHQAATVSFLPGMDCEAAAEQLGRQGISVRAGLHCAPAAHESAGTLATGTVRVSFGYDAGDAETEALLRAVSRLPPCPQ